MNWNIATTPDFDAWIAGLPAPEQARVVALKLLLTQDGPALGRPFVDTIRDSKHPNMKELRRGSIRILFAFDPKRTAVLLVGGDKRDRWQRWYRKAIPEADRLFDRHLGELRTRRK